MSMKNNILYPEIQQLNKNNDSKLIFNKKELGNIMNIYCQMVAAGEWRDYDISRLGTTTIFSIYKHATEYPVYMIKKYSSKYGKNNIFSIVGMDGRILKRGNDLTSVLKPLKAKLIRRVK